MKSLLLGSVLSAGIKVGSAGLTFLMFLLLARVLDPAEYGRFGTMFALGSIGAVAALLGQHTLSIKVLSGIEDHAEAGSLRRQVLRRTYLAVVLGAVGCIAILMLVFVADAALMLEIGGTYLLGACAFVLPFALAELVSHQYRAFGAISWALIPRDILWRGSVVLLCLAAPVLPVFFGSALTTMVTISGVLMVIVAVQIFYLYSVYKGRLAPSGQRAGPGVALPKPFPLWMWLASLVTMGANLNVVIAAMMLPADQIGAYFAAQKTSQLLQLPILAINIVAAPTFARQYARKDFAAMRDVGRKLAVMLAVPLTLGVVGLIVYAAPVLSLFDPAFPIAVTALIILAAGYLFAGLGGPVRQLMLMADGEKDLVRMTAIAEILGLVLIPVLVGVLGLIGAALAALVAKVVFTIMAVRWCRARLSVDTSILSLFAGKDT